MSTEFTPEQEKIIGERIMAKEKEYFEFLISKVGNVLKAMKERYGEEACEVLAKANSEGIKEEWRKKAEENGDNSIESLMKILWEPLPQQGFEYTVEKTDAGVQMKCTKCPLADMALRHGVGEYSYYDFCKNDFSIVEGFNPNIGFTLTKTIMQGDDCCNHFYYYKDKGK